MMMLSAVLALAAPAPGDAPDLAMMDMKAVHGVEDSLAAVLNESFLVALKNSGKLGNVVGGSDLRAMLDLEQQKQALGCGDDGCLAELGGALGVPYLFYTSLAKVGSKYVMHYKVMAVEEAKVVVRGMKTAASDDALLEMPQILVTEAMAGMFQQAPSAPATQPAPQATATPSSAPSAAAPAQPSQPIKMSRWLGVGLTVAGGGLAAAGYSGFASARDSYAALTEPTSADYANYEAAAAPANSMWIGGLGLAVVGAGLAVVAP
ncbi:MAG: hypothetical protein VYB65_04325 [Myxococcota bacterium]|nr:hypothetical protein [Myxococcota bacterium]